MYRTILAILGIFLLIDGIDFYFGLGAGSNPGIGTSVAVMLGVLGNQLYKEQAERQIRKIKQERGEKAPAVIKAKGGSSWGGFWLSLVIICTYSFLSIFLFPTSDPESDFEKSAITTENNSEEEQLAEEEESFEQNMVDEEAETLYDMTCSACHGDDLSGATGPDLRKVGAEYSKEDIK